MPITTTRPTATATMRHGLDSAPAGPAGPVVGPLDSGRGLIRAAKDADRSHDRPQRHDFHCRDQHPLESI